MELSTATPVQIDSELARIYAEQHKIAGWIASDLRTLERPNLTGRDRERAETHVASLRVVEANLRAEARPLHAEYASRPWSRYFLVANTNGHVHRGMDCTTCFPTTEYGWLVDLADCDEEAMVEEWGERACTVCFPNAPTLPAYSRPARVDREAAEAKAQEKASKVAEKAAKAITSPDGSPLRVDGWVIGTKVAAQRKLSEVVQSFGWYGPSHPSDFAAQAAQLVEALRAAGIDPEPIIVRATKKVRAEGGEHTLPVPVAS